MHASPPETTEKRRLVSEATAPASTLPSVRSARHLGELDPREPSAHGVRGDREQDRRAEDCAPVVRRTGEREEEERRPEARREPEADDRCTPRRGGDAHAEALPSRTRHPPREERRHERARIRSGIQEADGARASAEHLPERRKERARHAEDHRDGVDDEDPLQLWLLPDEPEAFGDRLQPGTRDRGDRRHRGKQAARRRARRRR